MKMLPITFRTVFALAALFLFCYPYARLCGQTGISLPYTGLFHSSLYADACYVRPTRTGAMEAWVRPNRPIPNAQPDWKGWFRCQWVGATVSDTLITAHFRHTALGLNLKMNFRPNLNGVPCYRFTHNYYALMDGYSAICPFASLTDAPTLAVADSLIEDYHTLLEGGGGPAKPVIYLYPPTSTNVYVALNAPSATQMVCYPEAPDTAWHIQATPDGMLHHPATNANFPSLFWEAQFDAYNPSIEATNEGWVVARHQLVSFLEARLNEMGFNSRERTEFIQYWLPRMMRHSTVRVHFAICDPIHTNSLGQEYAEQTQLTIEPKPENWLRVLVLWRPTQAEAPQPVPQTLPRLNRSGFHILEWGGAELPTLPQ